MAYAEYLKDSACQLEQVDDDGCVCTVCGFRFRTRSECGAVYCLCKSVQPLPAEGVGDKLERMLKKAGITQERWEAARQALGLPPGCGCDKRREWLNKAGQWLAEQLKKEDENG